MAFIFCNIAQNTGTFPPDIKPDLKYYADKFAKLAIKMTIEREKIMPTKNSKNPDTTRSIWPKLITISLILLTAIVAVSLLPRGFSDDISLIGKGTNALVLIHDNNILQSGETMVAMNAVRDEYAERLEFIVVDIKTPEGKVFSDRYSLQPAALVFFSANGEIRQTLYSPQTGESLRQELNRIFQY